MNPLERRRVWVAVISKRDDGILLDIYVTWHSIA